MRNRKILKESLLFPIKKYKHFILATILFLVLELSEEYLLTLTYNEFTILIMAFLTILLPLVILGINLQIIFHLLDEERGLPDISIKKSIKDATKDLVLETYYFGLTILITLVLSIPTGIYYNLHDIYMDIINLMLDFEGVSIIEIIGVLPEILMAKYIDSVTISTLIFIITFIILFSFCTLSKIDLEVHGNYKQTFNINRIIRIIKKIGIIKYLGFLFLIIVMSIVIANIVFRLNYAPIFGSLISAVLEAFSLFFFLHSFAQLYPD